MLHPSIRLEGSILSADILDSIERGERSHQSPKDFGLDPTSKVKDEIADAWAAARAYWAAYQVKIGRLREGATGTTETRNQWMVPLLGLLGYQLGLADSETIQGKTYRISHRDAARDQLPVHILGWHESLDRRSTVPNAPRMSPHGLVQEYLNLTEHLYGIVSNGRLLRLLRDSSRLVKLTFIEFDLERIFTDELYADFALLYRLLHASRLPVRQDAVAEAPIEIYHQDSLDSGSRIRDGLSKAVHSVILNLANGLLAHPENKALRALASGESRAASGKETASNDSPAAGDHSPLAPHHSPGSFASDFYAHLLRLIYRLLFLMVIEERGLVHVPGTDARRREIYDLGYSLARLRRLSEKPHFADARHHDAWLALVALFRLVDESGRGMKLGVAPLGGDLFGSGSLGVLEDCSLDNATFLGALRQLTLFTNPVTKQLMRVNYGALNVEEFGSVYQGLLEFEPRVNLIDGKWHFAFAQGDERSATGSHYTEDVLVQPLLKHSLDHLIADRLEEARRVASSEWRAVSEQNRQIFANSIYGILSRPRGLAQGDGFGPIRLRLDEILSQRGTLWNDQPDPQVGLLGSGKRGGGMGTPEHEGLPALPESSQWQSAGTGNPSPAHGQSRLDERGSNHTDDGTGSHSRSSALGSSSCTGAQTHLTPAELAALWSSLPLAARHSLLASEALLGLRVADIACGSGHILLAAARRVGMALAIVRTGDDQPSPAALREATRDVIRHCIYGVDLNPLAVELCKVALWLEAHVPGEPLGFLDHHIKCGNAIVGFVTQDELEKGVPDEAFKTIAGDDKDIAAAFRKRNKAERKEHVGGQRKLKLSSELQGKLDAVLARVRELSALPEHTPAEIAAKKQQFDATDQQDALLLRQIAAIPIAQFYQPKTGGNKDCLVTDAAYRAYLGGQTPQGQATASAWAIAGRKGFFHWFLEFPEIVARGGFDCILGNPPYLGRAGIRSSYGDSFCEWVQWQYAPAGISDLIVFFIQRIFDLTRDDGFFAIITTNSIKDGDVRADGLDLISGRSCDLTFVNSGVRWPGVANLHVSLISGHKGEWNGAKELDGRKVDHISTMFEDYRDIGPPVSLNASYRRMFQGSIFLGDGFLLSPQEVSRMVEVDPMSREVISPIINGQELNNNPSQTPGREIINFLSWDKDRAQQYRSPFAHLESTILPTVKIKERPNWWQFWRPRTELYRAIRSLDWCFAAAATTKHLNFSKAPTTQVFANTIYVFTTNRWDQYAVVQSTIHEVWARKYSGSLETRLRYSPSDCFETFAFPAGQWQQPNPDLASIGERYHEHRRDLMLRLWLGLTDLYNLFHAPDIEPRLEALFKKRAAKSEWRVAAKVPAEHLEIAGSLTLEEARDGILRLRTLHQELDQAVLAAYGWHDPGPDGPALDLGHAFHEVETLPENDRTRFTISPEARKDLLKRLLKLNHARAEEEQNAVLAQVSSSAPRKSSKKAVAQRPTEDLDLFRTAATQHEDGSTEQEFVLPSEPRKDLGTPDAFLLVFVSEFLDLAGNRATVRSLEAAFHLLRHRRSHLDEFIAVMGVTAEEWIDANGDTLPNDNFVPFLTRIESNGWIHVERKDGGISKTSKFPTVPVDFWRRFDIRAALMVIESRPQVAELILSDPESSGASKAFDQIQSA